MKGVNTTGHQGNANPDQQDVIYDHKDDYNEKKKWVAIKQALIIKWKYQNLPQTAGGNENSERLWKQE